MKIKENQYLSHQHFTLGKQTNKKMSKVKLMKGSWLEKLLIPSHLVSD